MGCDIHLHTEVKINGAWHHYSCPDVDRHYDLFARMAGVRNYSGIDPISEPRGIPEDATFMTKFACDDYDGHSHSWLNAEEIFILYTEFGRMLNLCFEPTFGYFFGNDWSTFWNNTNGTTPKGVEDVRFIFWFEGVAMKHNFGNGKVKAHRHKNGGGWVANTAQVAKTAYIGPNAKVHDNAKVCDYARVLDFARVYGCAEVHDHSFIYNYALVFDDARIYNYASVYGSAIVRGFATITDNAQIYGYAKVEGRVEGHAQVTGIVVPGEIR